MGDCRKNAKGDDKLSTISDDQGSCDPVTLPANGAPYWEIPFANTLAVAPGATTLTAGTIAPALTKLLIRKGSYIGAKEPGATYWKPIQLAADFVHTTAVAGTTMTIEPLAEGFIAGSTFAYPVPIGGTSSINPSRSRQLVSGASSDADGYKPSAAGTATAPVSITMDADDTDPGQLNVSRYQELGETCILAIHYPKYRGTLRKKVTRGLGSFSEYAETLANDATPTVTTTFNFDRKPETKVALAA